MRREMIRALGLAVGVAVALAWAVPGAAQDAPWVPMPHATQPDADSQHDTCTVDGWWAYNRSCCCTHGWCAPIPREAVREERGGWRVSLRPGDHPRVTAPTSWWVPPGGAGVSPDGRAHFCGTPGQGRCLLMPAGVM
jgi:hypothetical protein